MSAPDLDEAKRLMCDWIDQMHKERGVSYHQIQGVVRTCDPDSRSPGYEPDGRQAIIFHTCGDVAGLVGLLREHGL